jgi:uncharacterized membrane protein YphA (DoxX/SURF4 family)
MSCSIDVANSVLSLVLAVLCTASAIADFRALPRIVQALETVRCPPRLLPVLGLVKIAAAVGLVIGLAAEGLSTITALCLTVYFLLAVGAHFRVKDDAEATGPALVMFGLSAAALVTSL